VVEHPAVAAEVGRGLPLVLDAVDEPGDEVRAPLDGEGVERVGERAADAVAGADALTAGVPGPWMVPCTVFGSRPMFSMMSISPLVGQPTEPMSLPSIQKRRPDALAARDLHPDSNRPYVWVKVADVSSRADVYWQLPYQQL
jgi:hypothetical protein